MKHSKEITEFIKTDDNRIVNVKYIRWVKKMNECMELCSKFNGCNMYLDTLSVCKNQSPSSYEKLNKYFD